MFCKTKIIMTVAAMLIFGVSTYEHLVCRNKDDERGRVGN